MKMKDNLNISDVIESIVSEIDQRFMKYHDMDKNSFNGYDKERIRARQNELSMIRKFIKEKYSL